MFSFICGEGFIRKMVGRGIAVSVASKDDPIEAIEEYLANGENHHSCEEPRHKKHAHTHQHDHNHKCGGGEGDCSCNGE